MIFVLFLTGSFQQTLPKAGEYSFGKKVLLTISTFGLYPLVKAFIKSDETIIQETYKYMDHAKLSYANHISILDYNFKIDELTETQKNKVSTMFKYC